MSEQTKVKKLSKNSKHQENNGDQSKRTDISINVVIKKTNETVLKKKNVTNFRLYDCTKKCLSRLYLN